MAFGVISPSSRTAISISPWISIKGVAAYGVYDEATGTVGALFVIVGKLPGLSFDGDRPGTDNHDALESQQGGRLMSFSGEAHLRLPVSERDHRQGRADAPVTLVEYGDYECPYCGQAQPIVKHVQQQMGDRLQFAFRNFPLTNVHPHAQQAAERPNLLALRGNSGRCTMPSTSTSRI